MACKQRRSAHKLNSTHLAPPVSRYQMSKHAHVCLPTDGVRPTAALHAAAADSERTTCIADVPETMCTNFVILELSSFKLLLLLCWSLEYTTWLLCAKLELQVLKIGRFSVGWFMTFMLAACLVRACTDRGSICDQVTSLLMWHHVGCRNSQLVWRCFHHYRQ